MIVTVGQVLQTAATHLNDSQRKFWQDDVLITFLQEAYRDLSIELYLNGLPTTDKTIILPNFMAGSTIIGPATTPAIPSDIVLPVKLWERDAGAQFEDFIEMLRKKWEPSYQPDQDLNYWLWQGQNLVFVGATANKDIRLDYEASLPMVESTSDTIGFINGEIYLAPKTAAYAAKSINRNAFAELKDGEAFVKLDKIIAANVKNQQAIPVRRRPYRRQNNLIIGR